MPQPSPGPSPTGCPGTRVPGHTECLAHLADPDRAAYLAGLRPGADIDHRFTPFTHALLDALLDALRDPATGHPRLGSAWFEAATFERDAGFESATFKGDAWFRAATFERVALFESATFECADRLGPLVCVGRVNLSGAVFGAPVTLSIAARRLECRRTRWSSTAEVRLRYATVDFSHAVFE
ncbi:pentapeptide repeat-containing protein [Streptomyces canus]|uniref:pentapeptide repeat-containing protein n=1 Tax=Streptomyces canus TaxID=58343 RepID=UPI00324A2E9D